MTSREFQVPEAVRLRAESLGEAGRTWLAGLDVRVARLEDAWSIRVGAVLAGGSESLVAEVLRNDGTAAILKIGLPGSADLAAEARVYRIAAGRGYAELIAHDATNNALLLEKLGQPLAKLNLPVEQQIRQICNTLRDAWVPQNTASGLMTGAEKARWLIDFITQQWHLLDRPCDKSTIDRALAFAEEREAAFAAETSVLVHGDAHAFNALRVGANEDPDQRCKFVDPDGLFAERACDLAVPMRDWNEELVAGDTCEMARQRCDLLAELTEVDARAIWQWGFVERVSTGLVLLQINMVDEGVLYLAVADRLRDQLTFG